MSEGAHDRLSFATLPMRLSDERRPGTPLCGRAGACRRGRRSRRRGGLERKSSQQPVPTQLLPGSSRRPCLPPGVAYLLLLSCAAVLAASCAVGLRAFPGSRESRALRLRSPDLTAPLVDVLPPPGALPADPVKAGVFARINRDREAAGLPPVAWDASASRVADAFCRAQVREQTRGHFLTDGLPPYARTGFAGVFGAQSENSVSWISSGRSFDEPSLQLALLGQEEMMAEKPPGDGHRRTILDPEATHVGVGYANEGGRFQMAQEFLTRGLERLTLLLREPRGAVVRFDGKPLPNWRLEFVTIAEEPPPEPLTRQEATSRTSYSYPRASLAYAPEEAPLIRVSGVDTQNRIRVSPGGEFSFNFAPDRPGLYTFVFYTAVRVSEPARPAGSATIWVERIDD